MSLATAALGVSAPQFSEVPFNNIQKERSEQQRPNSLARNNNKSNLMSPHRRGMQEKIIDGEVVEDLDELQSMLTRHHERVMNKIQKE